MFSYKAFGLNIHSEVELPELSSIEPEAEYDLEIKINRVVLPKLKKTSIYRRGIRAEFAMEETGELVLHWDGVANFKSVSGKFLIVDPLTTDADLLSLFTVSEALGLILFQRGYFLLHASSVQVGNEAWCFMGSPGAGKSSTAAAFIKGGCSLLSDDLTAITFNDNNEPFVIPAYPQLKIWDKTVNGLHYDKSELHPVSEGVNKFSYQPKAGFLHEPVTLKKIYFLHKARNRSALKALNASEIPTETLKNFPLPIQLLAGEMLRNHFVQSFYCAKSAGMWHKRRPDGFELLEKWVQNSIPIDIIAGLHG